LSCWCHWHGVISQSWNHKPLQKSNSTLFTFFKLANTESLPHTTLPPRPPLLYHTEQTKYPTLSYGLAEGRGDLLSTSDGVWGNAEFGYNPLNNNLGASASTGSANSANIAGSDVVGVGPGGCVLGMGGCVEGGQGGEGT
jgi:hypothetical protein